MVASLSARFPKNKVGPIAFHYFSQPGAVSSLVTMEPSILGTFFQGDFVMREAMAVYSVPLIQEVSGERMHTTYW